ncbi:MAG: phosphate starvation-inducible protein PhoH [Bdellovibrionaceae bacterium]|nr:phosphate starvation-inducible protein PhoH [Pseudobdellovibrionaceae bacterium]
MKKSFVLDTNVILFDPQAIHKFGSNEIVIPMVVIEEVDRFKRDMSENGRHARQFSRAMDGLRASGDLAKGVQLPNGGSLVVELGTSESILPSELDMHKADNRILAVILTLKKENPRRPVVFVTKDINLRIKADALGMQAQDYEPEDREPDELYAGHRTLQVDGALVDEFYSNKRLSLSEEICEQNSVKMAHILPNEYMIIKDSANPTHTALARYSKELESMVPIYKPAEGLWGIFPKNVEQSFAVDALMNDDIKLVSLLGMAGTGKTLLAIAAGLVKTVDEGFYHRLLVSRPVFPLGKDIGFLPGDIEEKLNPWMQPIYDNIDFLFGATGSKGRRGAGKGGQELMNQGLLQIEPLTYIRGRSIPQQYLIVDESQNLTPHEIKTIVTRAGDDTKIVLTGDSYQIDNPYVDSNNNGLVYLVERFKAESISAHISLKKGERSKLSELASQLL